MYLCYRLPKTKTNNSHAQILRASVWLLYFFDTEFSENCFKVAKHRFRTRFYWCNFKKQTFRVYANIPSIERSFYLRHTRTICVSFLCKTRFKRHILHAPNQILILVDSNEYVRLVWFKRCIEFLIIQKTINGKLLKSPMSKFYQNSVDRRDLMSVRRLQTGSKA